MPFHHPFRLLAGLLFACLLLQQCAPEGPPRILIFSRTNGYRHQSIEAGKDALVKICRENGMLADTTENPAFFNEENLKRYAAVVFLNTNGDVLGPAQEADFERFIQAGGGFAGVHSATATEYTWRWYGGLVGAYFKDHPAIQEVKIDVKECNHVATRHLGCQAWPWKEELYNFRNLEPDLHVLLSLDETTYQGGESPGATPAARNAAHALAWCHTYDGGRAFYTALGHIPESYNDPVFQQHLLGGLRYAVGNNQPLRFERCRTLRQPDQTRFVKTVVAHDLAEPMEIAQFPDEKIILLERHGTLKLYDPATDRMTIVAKLPVYSEMGDGLLGVGIDPRWEQNHWIYLYYSSLRDSMNQLSRFVFRGDSLDRASERVLLTIPVGHKDCFHAAGSLAFDPDGYLYLSTGDNTSPFASDGFAPIDERPGRRAFDAQRSAANTMDLRGKILRIKPLPDGTYECPPGNLFAAGEGRPEIYIMGCRNPFRIAIDLRRNYLYWGDIGPDAGKSDTARGPLGHDEINQARRAGNFGWPYFVGNNQAYRDFDFSTQKSGPYFDPMHPVNASLNNTGARDLPPAQTAFIWYPYSKNRDFPIAGSGGRNAMAGPTYYCDEYPADTRLPDYYNGKTIIYDWMRGWLMAVTVDSLDNFHHLEPFADSVRLSRPMDMLVDKNGSIWLLEYGARWYSSNPDARLSRIDYVRGNRAPIARLQADKFAGSAPGAVVFSLGKSEDYDHDRLAYQLDFGDGTPALCLDSLQGKTYHWKWPNSTRKPGRMALADSIPHTYATAGVYKAILKVTDPSGVSAFDTVELRIGNEPPLVHWDLFGRNRSFYTPGDTLRYHLHVSDLEDGSLAEGGIAGTAITTSLEYLEKSPDPTMPGKKSGPSGQTEQHQRGRVLIEQSDCKSCHAVERQVNGPSFQAVAERYRKQGDFAVPGIYRKIIYGGSGNWGAGVMIPHPQIREEDAIEMALWILSLGDPPKPLQTLPLAGDYIFRPPAAKPGAAPGAFLLRASYLDRGHAGIPAQESEQTLVFRPAVFQAENCDRRSEGVGNYKPFDNDTVVLQELKHNAFFAIKQADFSGIKNLTLRFGYGDKRNPYCGGRVEIRLDEADGALLATRSFERKNAEKMLFETWTVPLSSRQKQGQPDFHDLYVVFKNEQNQGQGIMAVDWVWFQASGYVQ